jgi:hypothetical protein
LRGAENHKIADIVNFRKKLLHHGEKLNFGAPSNTGVASRHGLPTRSAARDTT